MSFENTDHIITDRGDLPPDGRVTVSPTYLMIFSGVCVWTTGKKKKVKGSYKKLLCMP